MYNIVIFGAPGSGKGTQSEYLIKHYGLFHISTGDVLRDHIKRGTELGKIASGYINDGKLIPDDLMISILEKVLDENPEKEKQGVIFDGFPRTTEQAKALKEMLARRGSKVDIVIGLDVPESELIDRLIKRGKESGRSDDNLETIKKRLDVYHSQTSPLRDHYVAEGIYAAINGLGSIEGIFEDIKKAIDSVHGEQLTAWVDNVKQEPLIAQLPKKGKITSEKENKTLGYKELTLSNGARVLLKKTNYKDDEVILNASSKGGSSLLGDEDIVNAKAFNMVIASSGLGNFNTTELQKALAGKQANANLILNNFHEGISGQSTPKDLETLFQLTYLYFTDIKKDEKSYAQLMTTLETMLKNQELSPDAAVGDSLTATLYSHNKRFTNLKLEDLKKVNYDRILQIAKERTANAADFTFTIVGNFDEAAIRPLIEQYIASLPAKGKKENWKKVSTYNQGKAENMFTRKMETPKATAYMYWYNLKTPYTLENAITASAAGQVLEMIYLKKIREDAGAAYSAGAQGSASLGGDTPFTFIVGICPMDPAKSEMAIKIMDEEAKNLCKNVDADMLNKVKELMLKRIDDNAKTNSFWVGILDDYNEFGVDNYTDYKKYVNALTPTKVSKFVKDVIFGGGNSVKVIMLPEK